MTSVARRRNASANRVAIVTTASRISRLPDPPGCCPATTLASLGPGGRLRTDRRQAGIAASGLEPGRRPGETVHERRRGPEPELVRCLVDAADVPGDVAG